MSLKRGSIMCSKSFYSCVNVSKITCNSSRTVVFVTYPSCPNLLNMHTNVLSSLTKEYIFISHFSKRGIFSYHISLKWVYFLTQIPPKGANVCTHEHTYYRSDPEGGGGVYVNPKKTYFITAVLFTMYINSFLF